MPAKSYITFPLNGPLAAPLVFVTTALPAGQVGSAYSFQYQAAGGVPPYTFNLVGSTGSNTWNISSSGLLTGTPGSVETDTVSARVQDSRGNFALTGPLTLTVIAASNYVFQFFLAPSKGGTLGDDVNNDGRHPTVTGQPGVGGKNQGPWTIGSLFNPQTIGATAQQIANNNAMAGQQIGIVGDQGVCSLADVGKTYPAAPGTGGTGMVLQMPNGSATNQTVVASCNSAGQYVPLLAVIDGGITTATIAGALTTNILSSYYMIGRFALTNLATDSQYCTVDGLEVRNCIGGGIVFGNSSPPPVVFPGSASPGWVAINNYVHHVYMPNEGAQVIGGVVGGPAGTGVLTVTSVTNGTIRVGDAVWNLTNGAGLAPLNAIQAYGTGGGTGTGGVGTYVLDGAGASNSIAAGSAIGTTSYGGNNLSGISFHGGQNIVQLNNYIADIIDLNNNVQAGANRRATGIKNWTTDGGTVQFNTIYATATTGFPVGGIEFKNTPQNNYVVSNNYINLANAGPYPTEDTIGCAGDGDIFAVTAPNGHFATWNNNIIIANPQGGWGVPVVVPGGASQSPLIVNWFNNTMVSNGAHGNIGRLGSHGATDQIITYHDNIIDRGTANASGNGGDWRFIVSNIANIDFDLYPTNYVLVGVPQSGNTTQAITYTPTQNGGIGGLMAAITAATAGGTPATGLEAHVQIGQALYVNASRSNASGKKASDWQLAAGPGKGQGTGGSDMGAWGGGVTQIGCNLRDPSMNP